MRKSAFAGVANKTASPSPHKPNLQPIIIRAADAARIFFGEGRVSTAGASVSRLKGVQGENEGGVFRSASSDFKALGAFSCNFVTPKLPGISHTPGYQML